ncbi:MAG: DUF1573 domain-containing protein [Bacteroidota bacterium]
MKKNLLLIALFTISFGVVHAQDDKPTLNNVGNENPGLPSFKFTEEEFNFGTIMQGDKIQHDFEFVNTGKDPLIISNAAGSCGCTVPEWPKEPIMGGAKGILKVTFNSAGKQGMQDKTVTLTSNAKQNPMVIHLKGNVDKAIEQPGADPNKSEKK